MFFGKKLSLLIVLFFLFACGKSSDSAKSLLNESGDSAKDSSKQQTPDEASLDDSAGQNEASDASSETSQKVGESDSDEKDLKLPEENKPKVSKAFSKGPYGTSYGSLVGDFSVNTLKGKFSFSDIWTGDDHFVFVFYNSSNSYFTQLWNSSFVDLINSSPGNVHYVFVSYLATYKTDIDAQKKRFDQALTRYDQAAQDNWKKRFHFVTDSGQKLDGWLGTLVKENASIAFLIDRNQTLREAGLLYHPNMRSRAARMDFMNNEVRYYEYLNAVNKKLETHSQSKVNLFKDFDFPGGWARTEKVEVELPAAEELKKFDTMLIELAMRCEERTDQKCPKWDHLANLYLCRIDKEDENKEKCDIEIARWVSAYMREGRWLTDSSQLLAFFPEGGKQKFMFKHHQKYNIDLIFHFSNQSKGKRPVAYKKLFNGGSFNLEYNKKYNKIEFSRDDKYKGVEIFALITGHGWGKDVENCAEFCNHSHHFTVNGTEYKLENKIAGTLNGCLDQISNGVVANQYGTWPLGRSNWCAGMDVKPWVKNIDSKLGKESNEITYKGLFQGKDYDPKPSPNANGNGFGANIDHASYLIYWE